MADLMDTLAGLITLNDNNLADIEATNVLDDTPVLKKLYAAPASNGTQHKFERKAAGGTSGFRAIGQGRTNSVEEIELVTQDLQYVDATAYSDKAIAAAYKKGTDAYLAKTAKSQLRSAFLTIEKQIFNGKNNEADGFEGLADFVKTLENPMMLNAGGTAAGEIKTSVYLIREGEDNCAVIAGNDGRIDIEQDPTLVKGLDANGKPFAQYMVPIDGWFGFQVGSTYDVVRICNITDEEGKGITDDLIAEAISKFPAGKGPSFILMNRITHAQLRKSRTATNPSGAPAPFPKESYDVEIIVTDAITNSESIITAA